MTNSTTRPGPYARCVFIDPLSMMWLIGIPVFMAGVAVVAAVLFVITRSLRRRRSVTSPLQTERSSGLVALVGGGVTAIVGYGWIMMFFLSQGRLPIEAAGSWNVLFGGLLLAAGLLSVLVGAIVTAFQLDTRTTVV